jgi:hypothetical protein
VHSGPAEVVYHFKLSRNNLVISRNYGDDYDLICFSGIEAMENIVNAISEVFNVENEKLLQLNAIYYELNGILYRKHILRETVVEG